MRFDSYYSVLRVLLMCVLFAAPGNGAAVAQDEGLAVLESVRGTVLLKRTDSAIWEIVKDGATLAPGDSLSAKAGSSSIIRFSSGDFIKLMPMSMCVVDEIVEEGGERIQVVSIKDGKAWAQASTESDAANRMILEAGGAVVDVTAAAIFIETTNSGASACIDVFNGTANLRGMETPDNVSILEPNSRALIENGATPDRPGSFASAFNLENAEYSCFAQKQPEAEISKTVDESGEIIIKAIEYVTFGDAGIVYVNFIKEENVIKSIESNDVIIVTTAEVKFTDELMVASVVSFTSDGQKIVKEIYGDGEEVVVTSSANVVFGDIPEPGEIPEIGGESQGGAYAATIAGDEITLQAKTQVVFYVPEQGATEQTAQDTQPATQDVGGAVFTATPEGEAQDQASETKDNEEKEEEELVITGTTTVTFTPNEETPAEATTTSTTTPGTTTSTDATEDEVDVTIVDATVPQEDIPEESLEQVCTAPPVISGFSLEGSNVADGAVLMVDGGVCEREKEVSLSWSIISLCGNTVSHLMKIEDDERALAGAEEGKEQAFKEMITLSVEQPLVVSISAIDAFGNESNFSFSAQLSPHDSLSEPPVITSISYSGSDLSAGDTADVVIDTCGEGTFTISGTAESKCWDVASVTMTQDGDALDVSGTGEWSAEHGVAAVDGKSAFVVKAVDSAGVESAPVSFNISYSVAEELLAAPTIDEVSFNDDFISSGDGVMVSFEDCDAIPISITGVVSTPCPGQIVTLTLKKNSDEITVSGSNEWSAQDEINVTDEEAQYSIVATNSAGAESEAFEFSAEPEVNVAAPEPLLEMAANATVEDLYSPMTLYRDNIEGGMLELRGSAMEESAGCVVSYVEVSLDDGGQWNVAEGTDGWTYAFQPSDETYYVTVRAANSAGVVSDQTTSLELTYSNTTEEDNLRAVFDSLIEAYQNKLTSNFTDLTSLDFSTNYEGIEDYSQLETSLDNKFKSTSIIYLKVSVESVTVTEDTGSVAFSWTTNSSSASYDYYAVFEFVKDEEQLWKFSSVQDDDTFLRYTSVAASILLTALDSDLVGNEIDSTTLIAEVRDSAGNLIGDGTVVTFTSTLGSIGGSPADTFNGDAEAEFFAGSDVGSATVIATSGGVTSNAVTIELHPESGPLPPGMRW